MIQVHIDDTIVDIVDKMSEAKGDDIILDFPLWHPILHNYISLKVLKNKAKEKKLIIATNDKIGKKIWKSIWIEYTLVKNSQFIEKNANTKLLEHNFTYWEYLKFQIHSYKNEISQYFDTQKRLNSLGKFSRIHQDNTPIRLFVLALIWSIWIFVFIYYFAISKSYIYIVPEKSIKKEAYNFIFKENIDNSILWNNKYIKITTLSKTIYSSDTFAATSIIDNNNRASWEIEIFNSSWEELALVPNTRFMDNTWIIYRSDTWVNVPAGVYDNFWNITPWSTKIRVTADFEDMSWKYVWSRWNIKKQTSLSLPWLSEESKKLIFAISSEDFSSGSDTFQKSVSQEDIERAEEIFIGKLKSEALDSIKTDINNSNSVNNQKIDILSLWESISYTKPQVNFWEVKIWDIRENFSINGSITVYVYSYDKNEIISKLKNILNEKTLQWVEKIEYVDTSSVRLSEVIYIEDSPFRLKGTFEIEAIFIHDFLSKNNTLINQLKAEIRGMDKHEAEKFLLNNTKISSVKITTRPFFVKNISNIYNNIIFKID